jgi:hypothetical protein
LPAASVAPFAGTSSTIVPERAARVTLTVYVLPSPLGFVIVAVVAPAVPAIVTSVGSKPNVGSENVTVKSTGPPTLGSACPTAWITVAVGPAVSTVTARTLLAAERVPDGSRADAVNCTVPTGSVRPNDQFPAASATVEPRSPAPTCDTTTSSPGSAVPRITGVVSEVTPSAGLTPVSSSTPSTVGANGVRPITRASPTSVPLAGTALVTVPASTTRPSVCTTAPAALSVPVPPRSNATVVRPSPLKARSGLPSAVNCATAKSVEAPALAQPASTIPPPACTPTAVATSSLIPARSKPTVAMPSKSNVVSSPEPSPRTETTAKSSPLAPFCAEPESTIRPSGSSVRAFARSALVPPRSIGMVRTPVLLNATSGKPAVVNWATAMSVLPSASTLVNPPSTIRPSGRTATAVAASSLAAVPKTASVALPSPLNVVSSLPPEVSRAIAMSVPAVAVAADPTTYARPSGSTATPSPTSSLVPPRSKPNATSPPLPKEESGVPSELNRASATSLPPSAVCV